MDVTSILDFRRVPYLLCKMMCAIRHQDMFSQHTATLFILPHSQPHVPESDDEPGGRMFTLLSERSSGSSHSRECIKLEVLEVGACSLS